MSKDKFSENAFIATQGDGANRSVGPVEITDPTVDALIKSFEERVRHDESGNEFWYARDLADLLEYGRWDNFLNVVNKARAACTQSGFDCENHFADVSKMVTIGSGAEREIEDVVLSRYASYLVAQNADGRKRPVAFAQTYFAIQTRRQESQDEAGDDFGPLPEDEKRLLLRDEIKEHNKALASAAKQAGVKEGIEFAIFQTEGYKGLYGGLDVPGIRRTKGLTKSKAILDHMGSTELAANLFRATQTEEKLRRDGVKGKHAANRTHFDVGRKVRDTIREIGGTMPEALPVAEDIKKVSKRIKKAISKSNKDE